MESCEREIHHWCITSLYQSFGAVVLLGYGTHITLPGI